MTSLSTTLFSYGLKTVYDTAKVGEAMYKENVAFARMPKNTKFPGDNFAYSIKYADLAGRSRSFSKAKANKAPSKGVKFLLTRAHDYALGSIDTETILASDGNEGALLTATKTEADSAVNSLKRSLGIRMFGNGSGKIGTVSSPDASTKLTLGNSDDITNFEVGMKIVFAADEDSALRDSGEALEVTAVDRDAGTMTVSANVTTIDSITDGDCIFSEGDYESAGDRNMVVGFDGWIPATLESGTFFNVSRPVDQSRLAGVRYTSTTHPGLTTLEAISLVTSRIKRNGQSPDTCYAGTDRFKKLIDSLGTQVQYVKSVAPVMNAKGEIVAEVGFDGVRIHLGGAVVECYADMNCPENVIHVQKLSTWEFKSLGEAPRWIVTSRDEEDADSIEFRLAYWGNVRCIMPAANGRYDWL